MHGMRAYRTNDRDLRRLTSAIRSTDPVAGYTHSFYRYPARFSPIFAREMIDKFSRPNDVILDPFMGGGTSIVEAKALGRRSVGSDVSSLAVFLAKTKTRVLTKDDRTTISNWSEAVAAEGLNLRNPVTRDSEWTGEGYLKNLISRSTWAIRKALELSLAALGTLPTIDQRMFARCIILRTAQWALDCRKAVPSANDFRAQFLIFAKEMLCGSAEFERDCSRWGAPEGYQELCLHQSALTLGSIYKQTTLPPPKLVLTSPPYPGVHVVYHRWQLRGRREMPAPFWIAGTKDGAGASFYTFGDRHAAGLNSYFETALKAFHEVAKIADDRTTVVQMIAFSNRATQLKRYLRVMNEAGFVELPRSYETGVPGRTWRVVPNRKWYASSKGNTASSYEVVLFHRLAR